MNQQQKNNFFKRIVGKFFERVIRNFLFKLSVLSLILALAFPFLLVLVSSAQGNAAFIREVRALKSDETGMFHPAGLAFSARANAFQVIEGRSSSAHTDLTKLTPFADQAGFARIAAAIKNMFNVTFDNQVGRLLILQNTSNHLLEVREDARGNLDPRTLLRYDATGFSLQNPQGMAFDSKKGHLYILDAVGPRLVRVELGPDRSFRTAAVSMVDLRASGIVSPRGLALDPSTGSLHVVVLAEQKLVELTQIGEVVATRNLAEFGLKDPQAMVFAPSGDRTDDPSQINLFLADSGQNDRQVTLDSQSTGQILELSLAQPVAAAAITFTSSIEG